MANVKLILVESIHRLGEAGDLVSVKPGFARNFLLPQGKALLATESRVKELEHKRGSPRRRPRSELKDLQAVKQQLEALKIEIGARAGESGKLFGSVTAAQIADKIEAAGLAIDRRRIDLREPIKEVGEHKVAVNLLRELVAQLNGPRRGRGRTVPRGGSAPRKRSTIGAAAAAAATTTTTTTTSARAARILLRASSVLVRWRSAHTEGGAVARSSRKSSRASDRRIRSQRTRAPSSDAFRRTTSRPRRRCSRRCCSTTSRSTRCSTKSSPTTSTIRRTS